MLSKEAISQADCFFISVFRAGPRQKPGTLAAHESYHLPLLPSGPGGVHEFPLRKTRLLPRPHSKMKNGSTISLKPIIYGQTYSILPDNKWRRERDSNPRYSFPYTRFPGVLLQPLGHLSVFHTLCIIKHGI